VGDISLIRVKKNAIELLSKELSNKKKIRDTIGTGSMNDPYMPLEKELGMVRKALQVIAENKYPTHIITKSRLVVRDTDLLQEISQKYAAVSFSITTADDHLSKKLEPGAPKTSERFTALENLAKKGIYTGVTLMPILPFINDTKDNLQSLLQMAKDSGASYVFPMFGVTLRKGSRDFFYQMLDTNFPGIKSKYESHFKEQYICDSPNYRILYNTFAELSDKLNLNTRINFYTPPPDTQLSLF
jgi:DNA repair photolyase